MTNIINYKHINEVKNNKVVRGYEWVQKWLFSTDAKSIGPRGSPFIGGISRLKKSEYYMVSFQSSQD